MMNNVVSLMNHCRQKLDTMPDGSRRGMRRKLNKFSRDPSKDAHVLLNGDGAYQFSAPSLQYPTCAKLSLI